MPSLRSFSLPEYCERTSHYVFSEPANALSSLAVIIVAIIGLRAWYRKGGLDRLTLLLVAAVFLTGIGSAMFHTLRSPLTFFTEIVPVFIFILGCLAIIIMRLFGQGAVITLIHLVGFSAATLMVTLMLTPKAIGNGSWFIMPLIAQYILGATLVLRGRVGMYEDRHLVGRAAKQSDLINFPQLKMGYALIQSGLLLAVALLARSYDSQLCEQFPLGLHFVWHLLVAGAIGTLLFACIKYTHPVASGATHQNPLQKQI